MEKVDSFKSTVESLFGSHTETAELVECSDHWAIRIWKDNKGVDDLSAADVRVITRPDKVHVGQEKYIMRLWKAYKARRISMQRNVSLLRRDFLPR